MAKANIKTAVLQCNSIIPKEYLISHQALSNITYAVPKLCSVLVVLVCLVKDKIIMLSLKLAVLHPCPDPLFQLIFRQFKHNYEYIYVVSVDWGVDKILPTTFGPPPTHGTPRALR